MRMVTTLAGQQLQKDTAKRKMATMSSIREDSEGDTGESNKSFFCVILHKAKIFYFVHRTDSNISLTPLVLFFLTNAMVIDYVESW